MTTPVTRRELIRRFRRLGFTGPFSGGKHQFMIRAAQKIRIPNPHHGEDVSPSLVREILRQASVSEDEWRKLEK